MKRLKWFWCSGSNGARNCRNLVKVLLGGGSGILAETTKLLSAQGSIVLMGIIVMSLSILSAVITPEGLGNIDIDEGGIETKEEEDGA